MSQTPKLYLGNILIPQAHDGYLSAVAEAGTGGIQLAESTRVPYDTRAKIPEDQSYQGRGDPNKQMWGSVTATRICAQIAWRYC